MMKTIVLSILAITIPLAVSAADEVTRVKIYDHNKFINQSTPVTERRCNNVEVPVYQTITRQGDAAGGALLGMLLGGLSGKAISGNDNGAAAGAVIGGLIGADKGSQAKTEQRIIGYTTERQCRDVNVYSTTSVEVYSHSTIRFYLNGERYLVDFIKK